MLKAAVVVVVMILIVPAFLRMWNAWVPGLLEDTIGVTAAESAIWTYFPYILVAFFFVLMFWLVRGRSSR